jgi:HK97 family phage prohead protease
VTDILVFASDNKIEGNTLVGMAHVFGQRAFVKTHYETFAKGAFKKALETSDVRAFYQHNPALVLGRQSSGTLRVEETEDGLAFSLDIPSTTYGNDLRELVSRGDISEMSFGFIPGEYEWSSVDGNKLRTHLQVRQLVDVSPVSIPAFGGTSIQLRGYEEHESPRSQIIRLKAKLLKENDL